MDRGAWKATVHGFARVRHDLVTKPPPPWNSYRIWYGAEMKQWDDRCHKSLSVKKAIQSDKINTKSKILKLSKGWVLAFQCIKEQRTVSHYKLSLGKSKEWIEQWQLEKRRETRQKAWMCSKWEGEWGKLAWPWKSPLGSTEESSKCFPRTYSNRFPWIILIFQSRK